MSDQENIPVYYGVALPRPFASILNSRQTKMPVGNDEWIVRTLSAIHYLNDRNTTILTSLGMHTWNLLTWAVNYFGGKQILVRALFPDENPEQVVRDILEDYALDPSRVGFALYRTGCPIVRPKESFIERDRQIIRLSDEIYPVSIRKNGNLASEILNSAPGWAKVIDRFRTDYKKPQRNNPLDPLSSSTIKQSFSREWNMLTHWTRSFSMPWPRENSADFYKAIALSKEDYPRSALRTLERILASKNIFGTSIRFRNDLPNVSFTSLSPADALSLMKWDSRSGQWSMEPYGLAIETDFAESMGVREVVYGDEMLYESLPENDRPYFQPSGKSREWNREREWRCVGDFSFEGIPRDKLLAIVPSPEEAVNVSDIFDIPAISLI